MFYRGKGDNLRLGHGTEEHIRQPKRVEVLAGKRVTNLSVGSSHCVAVTEEGEVYVWGHAEGANDSAPIRTDPAIISAFEGKTIVGAACGKSQVKCRKLLI